MSVRLLLVLLGLALCPSRSASAISCPPGSTEVLGQCVPPQGSTARAIHRHSLVRPQASPETSAPVPAPAVSPTASVPLEPVRAYLKASDIPPAGIGAYGVFAFHAKPTEPEMARYTMACQAFLAALAPQASLPASVSTHDQMLTIWPLDDPTAPEALADRCDYLLTHYDLFAADTAIRDATVQGGKFGGEGPFLIGWSPSDTRGISGKLVMVYDMSGYNSPDRFNYGFRFWKEKIVDHPEVFRQGWNFEQMRLAIRDFANQYGSGILQAAHLTGGQ